VGLIAVQLINGFNLLLERQNSNGGWGSLPPFGVLLT
jgi:hypothetical protein